jgi:PAS domain S-box-containing protein
MWTLDGAIIEANEAFLHMVQYGHEDLASGRVSWTDLTPAEWRNCDERAVADLKATGIFQPFEKEYFRKNGSRVPVLLAGALFEGGRNEGVAFVLDLSEQKRAEQERERLRQLEAELAHINRVSTLGEMAASLAHEIKQPIAAAITSANSCVEWLAHEPPNLDRARAAAARIDKYGNRAAEIIDRIRSLYKKSPPKRELVDVNGIIEEMLTLLKGEATRYSIAMRAELAIDPPKIMADRAAAAGVHEPHAQRHRSHEGLRRRAYGEVGRAGRSTPVLGQGHGRGVANGEDGSDLFCVLDHQDAGHRNGVSDQSFHCGIAWRPVVGDR